MQREHDAGKGWETTFLFRVAFASSLLYNQEFHSITVPYHFGILITPRVRLKRVFFN